MKLDDWLPWIAGGVILYLGWQAWENSQAAASSPITSGSGSVASLVPTSNTTAATTPSQAQQLSQTGGGGGWNDNQGTWRHHNRFHH
jgi:hypothetical protein